MTKMKVESSCKVLENVTYGPKMDLRTCLVEYSRLSYASWRVSQMLLLSGPHTYFTSHNICSYHAEYLFLHMSSVVCIVPYSVTDLRLSAHTKKTKDNELLVHACFVLDTNNLIFPSMLYSHAV